jgi:phosphotransferase system HPr (HPr) family protein
MSFVLQSRKKLLVENRLGLHIAPAAMIVKLLTQFPNVSVLVRNSDEQVDARSVMGLIMLEARKNSELLFLLEGGSLSDHQDLLRKLSDLFRSKFSEE